MGKTKESNAASDVSQINSLNGITGEWHNYYNDYNSQNHEGMVLNILPMLLILKLITAANICLFIDVPNTMEKILSELFNFSSQQPDECLLSSFLQMKAGV